MARDRATIEDVARIADVSVATVSRALRGMLNVAPSTRERVTAVAESLGYVAHPAASSLASGKTRTIGLVAPFFGIWYTGQVLAGVEAVLSEAGYDLIIYAVDTPAHRSAFVDRVPSLATRVDGLLFVDFYANPEDVAKLSSSGARVVALGEDLPHFASVSIDNRTAARTATEYLLGLGHRRIALTGAEQIRADNSPVLIDRRLGYLDALGAAGLVARDDYEIPGGLSVRGGAEAIEALIALDDRPTAVFCLSDEMAMGAIGRAREIGIDVPGEISVVGFDDHDLAEPFGLTTMRQPVVDLGEQIARWMLDIVDLDPGQSAQNGAEHMTVPVELVVRTSSTGPATRTL